MSKLFFLVGIELPTEPTAERVEKLRVEIREHAAAVVPFYTQQQPCSAACHHITPPYDINITVGMADVEGAR